MAHGRVVSRAVRAGLAAVAGVAAVGGVSPTTAALLGCFLAWSLTRWDDDGEGALSRLVRGPLDAVAVCVLRVLPGVAAVAVVLMFAAYVPHYLTWPWWLDLDTFAEMGQAWSEGVVPYRDIRAFNFPGQVYLLWILGRVAGPGRSAALYAADAALLAALAAALVVWSLRRFGGALPGLISALTFLGFSMSLSYEYVAQRDWHACALVVLGLVALEIWPCRWGRFAGALATALALTFRPQVVLFLPALVSAVDEGARPVGAPYRRSARAVAGWALAVAGLAALAFLPLAASGALRGFIDGVSRASYGGSHNKVTLATFRAVCLAQLEGGKVALVFAVAALLTLWGPVGLRRLARTWALALVGAFLYRPISPHPHAYLVIPLVLFWSAGLALAVAAFTTPSRLAPVLRLAGVLWVVVQAGPEVPAMCSLGRSASAVSQLTRGVAPAESPLGCARLLTTDGAGAAPCSWGEYQALLGHLRGLRTGTRVANLLTSYPPLSVNGAVGRRSPFPFESGILWVVFGGDPSWEGALVDALEREDDSVVVLSRRGRPWSPKLTLPRLNEAVERLYEPDARFGGVEVWRRKRDGGAAVITRR